MRPLGNSMTNRLSAIEVKANNFICIPWKLTLNYLLENLEKLHVFKVAK